MNWVTGGRTISRLWDLGYIYDSRTTLMTTAAICATRELSWRPSFYRGEQYDLGGKMGIMSPYFPGKRGGRRASSAPIQPFQSDRSTEALE